MDALLIVPAIMLAVSIWQFLKHDNARLEANQDNHSN
ncbi:hypothetical protein BJ963_003643 [Leifsonia soli]|uniref:Uncharacterized protein n=1 Tax=Leifsonia soli TaxID=582665 RepID=A0A852T6G8_9MICO|nr:hypothetical protein [Leifsonia soli]